MDLLRSLFQETRTRILAGVLAALVLIAIIVLVTRSSSAPHDSNSEIRKLEMAVDKKDIPTLKQGVNSSDPNVAAAALAHLVRLDRNAARDHVLAGLRDQRWQVREQAVHSLPKVYSRQSADPAITELLNKLQKDVRPEVRSAIAATAVQSRWLDGETVWGMIPGLIAQLDDPDRTVRVNAKGSLEKLLYLGFDKKDLDVEASAPDPRRKQFMAWLTGKLPGMKPLVVDFYDKRAKLAQK